MRERIYDIITDYFDICEEASKCTDHILGFLAENEIVVSDSPDVEHGALHGVTNWHD